MLLAVAVLLLRLLALLAISCEAEVLVSCSYTLRSSLTHEPDCNSDPCFAMTVAKLVFFTDRQAVFRERPKKLTPLRWVTDCSAA